MTNREGKTLDGIFAQIGRDLDTKFKNDLVKEKKLAKKLKVGMINQMVGWTSPSVLLNLDKPPEDGHIRRITAFVTKRGLSFIKVKVTVEVLEVGA